jgi:hypothetical protein
MAHNTLTIDGESSSVPGDPFSWRQSAVATINTWKASARFDFFSGEHDGYMRFEQAPALHSRSVLFLKNDYWIVRDTVETSGPHEYDLRFQFAADACLSVDQSQSTLNERSPDAPGLEIMAFTDGGVWHVDDAWVSGCYGARTVAPRGRFSARGTGPQEFLTFMIPRRAAEGAIGTREIDAVGGRAFELSDHDARDLVVTGGGETVTTGAITSDFKWCWARFDREGEVLKELVLIDGGHLRIGEVEILSLPRRAAFAVARRVGGVLRLEVDDIGWDVGLPAGERVAAGNFKSQI